MCVSECEWWRDGRDKGGWWRRKRRENAISMCYIRLKDSVLIHRIIGFHEDSVNFNNQIDNRSVNCRSLKGGHIQSTRPHIGRLINVKICQTLHVIKTAYGKIYIICFNRRWIGKNIKTHLLAFISPWRMESGTTSLLKINAFWTKTLVRCANNNNNWNELFTWISYY